MNIDKVIFSFFILLALTLNFSFVMGDFETYGNPSYHSAWVLFFAIITNIIATILKLGDRTAIGAMVLATSLAADLQLILAAVVWGVMEQVLEIRDTTDIIANVVALASGALLANIVSVVLLIAEAADSSS